MISFSQSPDLRALQFAAVAALKPTNTLSRLEFATTLDDTLAAAIETRDVLIGSLLIAQAAGVFAQVNVIVGPARAPVNALVEALRTEIEKRRAA